MNTDNKNILTPHFRITLAGCRLEVKTSDGMYKLALKRGDETLARDEAPRSHLTNLQALHKAMADGWGPSSQFYKVMTKFADIAEAVAARTSI